LIRSQKPNRIFQKISVEIGVNNENSFGNPRAKNRYMTGMFVLKSYPADELYARQWHPLAAADSDWSGRSGIATLLSQKKSAVCSVQIFRKLSF
jgi:hypothetical protein